MHAWTGGLRAHNEVLLIGSISVRIKNFVDMIYKWTLTTNQRESQFKMTDAEILHRVQYVHVLHGTVCQIL